MPSKIFLMIFCLAGLCLSRPVLAGGIAVGNGGSIVRCSGKGEYVFIDTVLYKNIYQKNLNLASVRTITQSFQRIEKILAAKIPDLILSFQNYELAFGSNDPSGLYIWQPEFNEPPQMPIENLTGGLPWGCANALGAPAISQAIARFEKRTKLGKQIVFNYDRRLFSTFIISTRELSLLLVHEWLWDITNNATSNAQLNYFLHSTVIDSLSKEQVGRQLEDFGIYLNLK